MNTHNTLDEKRARQPFKRRLFPWRDGNRLELLIDGQRFFPRMLDAIAAARDYIFLEMYLVESGVVMTRFVEALTAAARRGVTVRLLFDDFGSRELRVADRQRLQASGVHLIFYNPLRLKKLFNNMARDHRKLLLVDGRYAFVGGTGLADVFDPAGKAHDRWRETMVRIEGPVLKDWFAVFHDAWRRCTKGSPAIAMPDPVAHPDGALGRVAISNGGLSQDVKRELVKRIRAARECVWVSTAYFVPSWKIRRALRRAARNDVDVRLLLPGRKTDHPAVRYAGRRFYSRLLRNRVRIFEYQPRVLHNKVFLCDDWVAIGSSNMDRWNLRWNLEANQTVVAAGFAGEVRAMFEQDFGNSEECRVERWTRRSRIERLREYIWGRIDIWLHSLGQGRK